MSARTKTCATCKHWDTTGMEPTIGKCRVDPPRPIGANDNDIFVDRALWPFTAATEWCSRGWESRNASR